ncbi:unnamed protein product, partial [Brassica oleracea]
DIKKKKIRGLSSFLMRPNKWYTMDAYLSQVKSFTRVSHDSSCLCFSV